VRVIFAGTPEFAAVALESLIQARHEIVLVLTQPDRPAGRGLKLHPSEVKIISQKQSLTIFQPTHLKDPAVHTRIAALRPDVMVVAAYGCILPKDILDIPRLGCINIHASLLPRWRGAAPIQRAILAGDRETGISIMQMDVGLDTGGVLLKRALSIGTDETAGELHDRLAALGGQMIVEVLAALPTPQPQDPVLATYAAKITSVEAAIDWRASAEEVLRQIRAFNPFPGASAQFDGERVKFWRAHAVEQTAAPGTVCQGAPDELTVACGTGAIAVTELQRAGGKRLSARAFLAGNAIAPGARFTPA
jgi:methionyl-tRNA formyltransferase